MAVINGNNDPNILQGTNQNDTMHALAGNDIVYGNDGNDLITGGLGNDILHSGNGDDVVNGEAGNDRLVFSGTGDNRGDGGDGNDLFEVDLSHLSSNVSVSTSSNAHLGTITNYRVRTSDESFHLIVNSVERSIFRSGAGDDSIHGTIGKDVIYGNAGDDDLGGFLGGNDRLFGGAGDDLLTGLTRNVRLSGGTGDDSLTVQYKVGSKTAKGVLDGGRGHDVATLKLTTRKDHSISFVSGERHVLDDGLVVQNVENLRLFTGDGDDTLDLTPKAFGQYLWSAGVGQDHLILDLSHVKGKAFFFYYSNSTHGGAGTQVGGKTMSVNLSDIEGLTLTGNDRDNRFNGGDFENLIRGGAGDDEITGGNADDRLFGEDDRDVVSGRAGDDLLDGGAGADFLDGGLGNDTLLGGTGTDRLWGYDGNDQLDGGAGTDFLFGGDGDDILNGGTEQDRLYGDAGEDRLNGGEGRDRIDGGTGADDLTGGGGADLFIFDKGDGTDRILDFALGSDQIHLRRTGFSETDMILTQQTGYVEITFAGDTSTDGTVIQVMNVTLAELENEANFIF
jgi:Ca2+-binding RTX toxin-like protein